ncbi:hypothetical protein [Paraburkholderia sp. SIMBA_027]|uniref:hypothetical protein n=1 Tax=Paraburkholderia sp. SIMBA_027 TaxID=3085770 RepID=UPI00397CFCE5
MIFHDSQPGTIEDHPAAIEASMRASLSALDQACRDADTLITLRGKLRFTKSGPQFIDGVVRRDFSIEARTREWIQVRDPMSDLLGNAAVGQNCGVEAVWPRHYPVRFLSGNAALVNIEEVFVYFPYALELEDKASDAVFGFEFVDVSESIIEAVHVPCMQAAFAEQDWRKSVDLLLARRTEAIYLYSILHEISHGVGPWRVIPSCDENLRLSAAQLAIMGELAADLDAACRAANFPEVGLLIFMNRIFWYARRGFADDNRRGKLNADNDAWGGAWLWERSVAHGLVSTKGARLILDVARLPAFYESCRREVTELGQTLLAAGTGQRGMLDAWMRKGVPGAQDQFIYPESLCRLFQKCSNVPEHIPRVI